MIDEILVKDTTKHFFVKKKMDDRNSDLNLGKKANNDRYFKHFMVSRTYTTKGVRIKMGQEIKDYLERKLTFLATKDDIKKIGQETNANFRKLKEESKSQVTEWRQKIKAGMEKIGPNSSTEMGPTREEMKEWVRKIENGNQFVLSQFRQAMDSFLQGMKETGEAPAIPSGEGVVRFLDQMKKIEENMTTLGKMIREGFTGVKDELGSMIKFSYSDLEKKMAALEARVKTLEKMVLP